MWKVGIDTGGTFTDIFATDGVEFRGAKVPSTPPDFERGVLASVRAVSVDFSEIGLIAHGTTVSTNAVITKSGARTGLITTRGFRDILELRRHNRGDIYDVLWDPPPPLVPRQLRMEVTERVNYNGEAVKKLEEQDVLTCIREFRSKGVESLAICFLHAYQNPIHEHAAREIVQEEWPELFVSISSDLVREPQEFERTSTTVANAYVGPVLAGYIERLQSRLREEGFAGKLMIMHSGGGLLPADAIIAVPARTLTSGPSAGAMAVEAYAAPGAPTRGWPPQVAVSGAPAAGAMATGTLAEATGLADVISVDIGGTSADIGVILNGRIRLIGEYEPEFGLPIRFPAVDLISIGAGGGSIAWVDPAGAPRVGPQSAGAIPGPACYRGGGTDATVTDACVVLGRLPATTLLGGEFSLDISLAYDAVERFAERIGTSVDQAALGIIDIAISNMARAIRVMTVERGLDPRRFVLVAFGGAGPMLACDLAESIGVSKVLLPLAPGVLSALGTLQVDVVHDLARSYIVALTSIDVGAVNDLFAEMDGEALAALQRDGVPPDRQLIEHSIDLRYVGQVKTLAVPLPANPVTPDSLASPCAAFFEEYERRFHYVAHDISVEAVALRVRARGCADRVQPPRIDRLQPGLAEGRARGEVMFRSGRKPAERIHRSALGPGSRVAGPAIIEQLDTTTVVNPGWEAVVDKFGNVECERR